MRYYWMHSEKREMTNEISKKCIMSELTNGKRPVVISFFIYTAIGL